VTKKDIEDYFGSHGTGKITEIKLMNGFGFIEYEDAMDARDVVPGMFPAFEVVHKLTILFISFSYVPILLPPYMTHESFH
jgi:hypothetical protein